MFEQEKCCQPKTDFAEIIAKVRCALDAADRIGESSDFVEGVRYIQISDTLAKQMSKNLKMVEENYLAKLNLKQGTIVALRLQLDRLQNNIKANPAIMTTRKLQDVF